jgi:hypothetical protein
VRTGTIVVTLAGVVVVAGIGFAFLRDQPEVAVEESLADIEPTTPIEVALAVTNEFVQVDALAENPDQFQGEFVLRAAVAGVNEAEKVFGVIDAREFESCGRVDCCKEDILPIKFAGKFPKPKTIVRITGRVTRNEKGLIFEANRVEPEQ